MQQKKLGNNMPILGVAIAMAIVAFMSAPGWGFIEGGPTSKIVILLGVVACVIGIYLENETLEQKLLYIIPYSLVCIGAVYATHSYLKSVTSTLQIVIFLMAILGAIPGLIIYYIMHSYFEKVNERKFEAANPELIIQWEQSKATITEDELFYITTLKKFIVQKLADDKGRFDDSMLQDTIDEKSLTKQNALRYIKVYEAHQRRDMIADIKEGAKSKKKAKLFLAKFIEHGIVEPEWPHNRNSY
jgi:Ca2+/Na+ antiporter